MKATSSDDNPTATKCLSAVLRSLLCTGSLPTHPSDQFNMESNTKQIHYQNPEKSSESEANHVEQPAATSKPGVVARLMGLDSLPVSPLPPRQKTLGSYFRSRSVNSMDFLSQFDPVKQAFHRQHRRVRTSVSFREVPSLFVLDDRFSVVFPLEEVDEAAENGEDQLPVARKASVKGKTEKRVGRKSNNGENFEEKTVSKKRPGKKMETGEGRRSGSAYQKKDFNGRTSVKLKEGRAVINKPSMDSKERRPSMKQVTKKKVHGVEKIYPEPTGKGEVSHEICPNKHSSPPRKPKSSSCPVTKNGEIRAISKSKTEKKPRNECTNMLEDVTQESVDEINCDWTDGQIEDIKDLCVQYGEQILEVLLIQIVDELMLLYGTRN